MGLVEFDPVMNRGNRKVGNFMQSGFPGEAFLRRHNPARGVRTPQQDMVAAASRVVCNVWKHLPPVLQMSWNGTISGSRLSGYGVFMKRNIPQQIAVEPYEMVISSGMESIGGLTVASSEKGTLTLLAESRMSKVHLIVMTQRIDNGEAVKDVDVYGDVICKDVAVNLSGLVSAAEYFVYVATADKTLPDATKLSESISFRIRVV